MARRKKHEDHINHEAWAIPYGDLITLLLAFFVVMYSMSSINEGKYRILSDSLVAAFRGSPKSMTPINVGENKAVVKETREGAKEPSRELMNFPEQPSKGIFPGQGESGGGYEDGDPASTGVVPQQPEEAGTALVRMAAEVERELEELIARDLVTVTREDFWLEVEIKTDMLFASGVAEISDSAMEALTGLADILAPFTNPIRVEGHTDNVPIRNWLYRSNWDLSAARAASVVHVFRERGVDPARMEIIGLGEFQPVADNGTPEGRNSNRRVTVVVLEPLDVTSRGFSAARTAGGHPPEATAEGEPAAAQTNRYALRATEEEGRGSRSPSPPGDDEAER